MIESVSDLFFGAIAITGTIGILLSLCLSMSLQMLWSLLHAIQLIVHLPIFTI